MKNFREGFCVHAGADFFFSDGVELDGEDLFVVVKTWRITGTWFRRILRRL